MKNWTKRYHGFFEKKKIEFTHWFAAKLSNSKGCDWRLFRSLRSYAKRREEILDETACPQDIQIELFSIAYTDSYFLEDFQKLGEGLERILAKFKSPYNQLTNANKWLSECSFRSFGSAWLNVGYFPLNASNQDEFNSYFDGFQIQLTHFSPSIMFLTIATKPSAKLKTAFAEILSTNAKQEMSVKKITRKHGVTAINFTPERMVREIEIDEFFLDINRYIVRFLRKYIGAGLAEKGPLRTVEILKLKQSLDTLPDTRNHRNFFDALGKKSYELPYCTGWYQLYKVNRSKHYDFGNYQALLSETDYTQTREVPAGDISRDMYSNFSNVLIDVATLVSTKAMLDDLNKAILELRNRLTKRILNRMRSIKRDFRQFALLNETYFKYQRIYNEMDKNFVKHFFSQETKDLKRDDRKGQNKIDFIDDIIAYIGQKTTFIENQVQYLKTSYSDYINLRFTKSNYRLQFYLVLLTVVLAVLTLLLVFQENTLDHIKTFIRGILDLLRLYKSCNG